MSSKCLNCETELKGNYCQQCGQKASTQRMSFSSFIKHDLLHGILHLDKGIIYTIKSLIYQPGYAAANFIKGKRVVHYNIFALFIIVVGLKTLFDLKGAPHSHIFDSVNGQASDEIINTTIQKYFKLLYFLCIPVISLFSFIFFRKLRYNFIEHIVLNCFLFSGGFFYALLISLFSFITKIDTTLYWVPIMMLYFFIGYYQAGKAVYNWFNWLWRSIIIEALFLASLLGLLILVIEVFYGGRFEGHIAF